MKNKITIEFDNDDHRHRRQDLSSIERNNKLRVFTYFQIPVQAEPITRNIIAMIERPKLEFFINEIGE